MEQFGGSPCEGEESDTGSCSEIACPQEGDVGEQHLLLFCISLYLCSVQVHVSYVFFKHELVYLHFELDVVFGLVLPGWRKDCVGLA